MNIEIQRLQPIFVEQYNSTIVAQFNATVGPFTIRRATLRKMDNGEYAIGITGRQGQERGGITLPHGSPVRDDLLAAVLAVYEEQKNE